MDAIREYLAAHPDERDQILHYNESYIFFQWSQIGPAIGNLGRKLTPGRSIAADQRWIPPGALTYLDSRKPVLDKGRMIGWERMQRFVTVQDTGSGLKGPGRVDVFWGAGDDAGKAAGQMKEDGTLYLLLLKEPTA
jgi:membrane-bound lytic murein transglycosylase A